MWGFIRNLPFKSPVAICIGLACALPNSSTAATLRVDQARPGNFTGDGTTWETAFKTVTDAMSAATSGDEIWVARGVYPERITLKAGVKLFGGFDATETLLSTRDWNLNHSILDGQADGTVVTLTAWADENTRLDGLTIRNGRGGLGGGVQAIDANPVIANNRIIQNVASSGGGIYTQNSSAIISSNLISGNSISNSENQVWAAGGGICNLNSSVNIVGNQIVNNSAFFGGGGIRCWDGNDTIIGNTITANRAEAIGGAIEIAIGSATISLNRITGNAVTDGGGSAVSVFSTGTINLTGNLVAANTDKENTVFVSSDVQLTLHNNTFLGNLSENRTLQIDTAHVDGANNIVAFNRAGVGAPAGATWRNNCVFGNKDGNYADGMADPTGTDGNMSVDPQLGWSRALAEFHLRPGSPCVDAGTSDGLILSATDIDEEERVHGSAVDIGADELGAEPVAFTPQIVRASTTGDDANDGSSWVSAKRTVQSALDEAMINGGEVWVAEGLYSESPVQLRPLVKLYGGFVGTETQRDERDPGLHPTVLDGGGLTNVVEAYYMDEIAEINGFTIQNGLATNGAGLRLRNSPINIFENVIRQNRTTNWANSAEGGAGIYSIDADPVISGNLLQENTGIRGAAIRVIDGAPTILRNMIFGNTAEGIYGLESCAGVHLAASGALVANNHFTANQSLIPGGSDTSGTAIWTEQPATIVNNTFHGNTAITTIPLPLPPRPGAPAGQAAIYLNANGSVIANNIFDHNVQALTANSFTNHTVANNAFHRQLSGDVSGLPEPAAEDGNIFVNPGLVGPYSNLHLAGDSPCRNAGDNAFVDPSWMDYDGDIRVLDGTVDMGADEFDGSVPSVPGRIVFVKGDGDDTADGRTWETSKRTIQAGLDLAFALGGADVWVAKGHYPELIQIKPFTYLHGGFAVNETWLPGRDLLQNQSVIDANRRDTAVRFDSPGRFSAVTGFTIVNGFGFFGGGIYCGRGAAPLIANNRIFNCTSGTLSGGFEANDHKRYSGGGGIRGEGAAPVILNNIISSNYARMIVVLGQIHAGPGGISLTGADGALVANNTLVRNAGEFNVSSLGISGNAPEVRNNIIAFGTGGISVPVNSTVVVENNCFFGNDSDGATGINPVLSDPRFVDDQATFFLAANSPCIDSATAVPNPQSTTDVYGRARIANGTADIGAVEMQPDDMIVPVTAMPAFEIEVVGGIAYLKYQRSVQGGESGDLLPEPRLQDGTITWTFHVSRDPSIDNPPSSFIGTIPLGPLAPGTYRVQPVSWGAPLAQTSFVVPADGGRTLINPQLTPDGFRFSINGVANTRYHTDRTTDFLTWEPLLTTDSIANPVLIPTEQLTGTDHFRVRIEANEVATP